MERITQKCHFSQKIWRSSIQLLDTKRAWKRPWIVCNGRLTSYFKISPLTMWPRTFKEHLSPKVWIYHMFDEHSVEYHSSLLGLNSRISPSIFYRPVWDFSLVRNFVEEKLGWNLQVYGVQITGKCIYKSKICWQRILLKLS